MIFKKSKALYFEKMNKLREVTVTDETVKFQIDYSNTSLKVEDIPKLLADVTQLYALVQDSLQKKSEEINKEKTEDDEPINLDDIPF
jgi:NACalpha-BTF3-like transcription factor